MLTPTPLPRTLEAALRDATDKKLEVRISAVRELGRLAKLTPREPALEQLARSLAGDTSPAVRAEAALALADAAAKECVADLVRATDDDNGRVQQMALVALGELATDADREACEVIERALDAEAPEHRFQALVALHHIASQRARPHVLGALADPDPHIRYVALRIFEEQWVREGQAPPPDVIAAAKSALSDAVAQVRLAGAILLARIGDDSGKHVIVRAVESGDGAEEPEDAQAAIELSGTRELGAARAGLERRAWGLFGVSRDPFAWQARVALARLGDERAKSTILKGLRAWTRDARTLAVAAAGRAVLTEARPLIAEMRGDAERADPEAVEEALTLIDAAARAHA